MKKYRFFKRLLSFSVFFSFFLSFLCFFFFSRSALFKLSTTTRLLEQKSARRRPSLRWQACSAPDEPAHDFFFFKKNNEQTKAVRPGSAQR
jgi:hypothetical protein